MTVLQVAAGVLVDDAGRILLASRPPGKQLAGMWEFPGGKLEAGESVVVALRRELREELDIEADAIEPVALIDVPWRAGARPLCLHAHRVLTWQGTPRPCEGQSLVWLSPGDVPLTRLAPADRHILGALL